MSSARSAVARAKEAAKLPRVRRLALFTLSMLLLVAAPRAAHAAGTLSAQGTPIQTSNYSLDLFQGPTLASSRVTAMGGAYAGLAEGSEGIPTNAAAASQRYPYSTTRMDYEVTGSVTFPGSVSRTDFDNNGRVGFRYDDFVFATLGGFFQYEHWGFGSVVSAQNYSLGRSSLDVTGPSGLQDLTLRLFKVDLVASYGFLNDQLHIGGGLRGAVFSAATTSRTSFLGEKLLFGTYGAGLQVGALWRPLHLPLRFGATFRSPILASTDATTSLVREDPATGDRTVGGFFLPNGVNQPFEAEWGIAVQIGPRPLNIPWTDEDTLGGPEVEAERRVLDHNGKKTREPEYKAARRILRQRYRAINRQKLLLSYAMLVTGPTGQAVGIESMLRQVVDRSGEKSSLTVRAGGEVEVVRNVLQLRGGSYVEPTRFRESTARLHATAGFEMRVLDWSVFGLYPEDNSFRISGAVDVSREYFGWSLGIGSWY